MLFVYVAYGIYIFRRAIKRIRLIQQFSHLVHTFFYKETLTALLCPKPGFTTKSVSGLTEI